MNPIKSIKAYSFTLVTAIVVLLILASSLLTSFRLLGQFDKHLSSLSQWDDEGSLLLHNDCASMNGDRKRQS